MRWKTAKVHFYCEQRHRIIFALVPHACNDGYTRWLTRVTVHEMYQTYHTAILFKRCWEPMFYSPVIKERRFNANLAPTQKESS
jgi:hypothetical protein